MLIVILYRIKVKRKFYSQNLDDYSNYKNRTKNLFLGLFKI
jgi:hypothetical protein